MRILVYFTFVDESKILEPKLQLDTFFPDLKVHVFLKIQKKNGISPISTYLTLFSGINEAMNRDNISKLVLPFA